MRPRILLNPGIASPELLAPNRRNNSPLIPDVRRIEASVRNGYFTDHVRVFTERTARPTLFSPVPSVTLCPPELDVLFPLFAHPCHTLNNLTGPIIFLVRVPRGFPRAPGHSNRDDRFRPLYLSAINRNSVRLNCCVTFG